MTHSGGKPHTNVGDRGQRYEVRATGYPRAGAHAVGWSTTFQGAATMAFGIRQAPGCTDVEIVDRQEGKTVYPFPMGGHR